MRNGGTEFFLKRRCAAFLSPVMTWELVNRSQSRGGKLNVDCLMLFLRIFSLLSINKIWTNKYHAANVQQMDGKLAVNTYSILNIYSSEPTYARQFMHGKFFIYYLIWWVSMRVLVQLLEVAYVIHFKVEWERSSEKVDIFSRFPASFPTNYR